MVQFRVKYDTLSFKEGHYSIVSLCKQCVSLAVKHLLTLKLVLASYRDSFSHTC